MKVMEFLKNKKKGTESCDDFVETTPDTINNGPYEYVETVIIKEVTLKKEDRFLYDELENLDRELISVQDMTTKEGKFEMQELILDRYEEVIRIASSYTRHLAFNSMSDRNFNPVMKSISNRIIYSIVRQTVVWFETKRENVSVEIDMVRKNKEIISLWYKY